MGMDTKRKRTEQNLGLSEDRLDELGEEAIVDAYGESEQTTGFYTMMEDNLRLPFETEILGVAVTVESIDFSGDDDLVAVCRKDRLARRSRCLNSPCPRR